MKSRLVTESWKFYHVSEPVCKRGVQFTKGNTKEIYSQEVSKPTSPGTSGSDFFCMKKGSKDVSILTNISFRIIWRTEIEFEKILHCQELAYKRLQPIRCCLQFQGVKIQQIRYHLYIENTITFRGTYATIVNHWRRNENNNSSL